MTLLDLRTGTELAWIDDAHFHPSCLRPAEVLHPASRQAAPPTRHLATLLLLPFAVVTNEGDARTLETAAQLAWEALGFEGTCSGLSIPDFRNELTEWHLDERRRGCLRQVTADVSARPLYSLRVEENPDFPAWLSDLGR
ncbi:MAG: hypothetical protein Q8L14_03290 [Myxococcales bacterium]|nr:hypothetical protein [Myxococcales bacterium]